ncbi:MAG: FAD:protein FMN transferase [Planctomycetales bacterium]
MLTLAATVTLIACCGSPPGLSAESPPQRYEFRQMQMGMPFKIVVYAVDEDSANGAARAAYARIRQLNGIMSDYDADSELMRLCRTAGRGERVPVSPELLAVLSRAQTLSRHSDGAFDVTVGPLVRLWRQARKSGQFPSPEAVEEARGAVGYRQIALDEPAGTVELKHTGMRLDLGGIAAGYAVDEALRVLKQQGIHSALIDASGDIGVSDPPPGQAGWRIGIAPLEPEADPSRYLLLKNAAVTTSGDAYQFIEFEGRRYSHIVDPRTGLGLTERSSVTVIAPDCTTADSYATAVSVLGPDKGLKLIEATPHAAALIVRAPDGTPQTFESKRLKQYLEGSQK